MKEKALELLRFFRLVDNNNLLSITNISVIIMVGKIASTNATSMQDIAVAIVALMAYAHKKHLGSSDKGDE